MIILLLAPLALCIIIKADFDTAELAQLIKGIETPLEKRLNA
ncbi:MAG TPA: hypothetical protein VJ729_06775 [Nitrososphaeraceae archaeon]|nr:hypothetical protein [Nitrososphaeraceae archaeon]